MMVVTNLGVLRMTRILRNLRRKTRFNPEVPVVSSERVEDYQGNLRSHIYIKNFRALSG